MTRTRQTFPSREVAHIWAKQTQQSGRNTGRANFYFEGPTIYSYGPHFPIATFVDAKRAKRIRPIGRVVLLTTNTYSSTTAKHISYTHRAIPADCLVVRCPKILATNPYDCKQNALSLIEGIESLAKLQTSARKRDYRSQISAELHNLGNYAKLFGVRLRKRIKSLVARADDDTVYATVYAAIVGIAEDEYKALEQKRAKARRDAALKARIAAVKHAQKLSQLIQPARRAWLAGWRIVSDQRQDYPLHSLLCELPVMLKVSADGNEIETSHGARVKLSTAKALWPRIKSHQLPAGEIDGYRFLDWEGDNLCIGCHKIPFTEMQSLATTLGLEP